QKFLFYYDQLHLTSAGFAIVAQYISKQLQAPLTLQATSDMSMDVARQFGRTLTSRMDTTAPRDGDMPEGMKFFIVGDGYSRKLDAGPTNDAYRSSGLGATAGVEYGFGSGLVGAAVNYSKPKVNFGNDAAETESRSLQLGGYGVFGIAGGFVQAYAGYGWNRHDIDRAGVVEGMEADPDGNHLIAGVKGGYLMPVGSVRVGPVVGLDYAKAKVDGYTETGDPVLTLNVDSLTYRSLRGSLGVELRGDFAGGGVQLRPFASAVVEKDFTGDGRTVRFSQTSAPAIVNSFDFDDASKKAYGRISGGFSAAILSSLTLDAAASLTAGKDQGEETSAQLGLRFAF
ncbi:MAG TPA: autotransporter outer membrane beta-barrel domain-containing protein, partial [Sphingomicrobium sp.]|nr:autotransporter outer membrane beta-barrel domain-containing protein [Sphingomicrobium sp.]